MSETLKDLLANRYGFDANNLPEGRLPDDWPAGLNGAVQDALSGLLGRSSCRRYRPDPLAEGVLEVLLACAQSAPSKSDLQQYAVIVVESREARREIAGWLQNQPWVGEAPAFLVFCGDMRRNRLVCEMHGRTHDNNNLDTFMNAAVDCALAMGAFIHAAETAGLGTCPISMIRNRIEDVTRLLALPEGVFPVAGLCVGYPEALETHSPRLPQAVVVHRDRYDDTGLQEAVADYDRRRHDRKPLPAGKQKNAKVYGTSDYCPWSDQVSRQLSLPERAEFGAYMRDRGFDPG